MQLEKSAGENSFALKEWASLCTALATGRQTILLRKGGISEGSGGFRFEHNEFWLYPTRFHQSEDQLTADGQSCLDEARTLIPPPGRLWIRHFVQVQAVAFLKDERQLESLRGLHVMSDDSVRERFHYRKPGLYVAAVSVSERALPLDVEELAEYAGCHSWVEFADALPTEGLYPVGRAENTSAAREVVLNLR